MTRSISIALILLVLSGVSHAFQPSVPSTAHRSVTSGGKASSSALFDYVPKWKKKETLADSAGDMSEEDKGLMGIIPVIFKQGNETRRTLASPGQPLSFVAAQAGQSIRYGCKKGECGTCECMANGKWIRPCVETVPDWAPGQELVLNIKELKNKSKSSGKFYSVKSFFMGFYNNFVGMFGFVKQRKAAKKNWEERQEYEHLVKVLTAEKKAARLAKEADDAEELKLEIAAVLKKEAEAAEAQRVKLTAEVAEEREAAGVHQIR